MILLYYVISCWLYTISQTLLLEHEEQTIVLLSFDGFRYDYIKKFDLENFERIAYHGVKADSLEPTFITKTFPNHFTIVTGLYEESHGIVANYMYDPVYKEYFDPVKSSKESKWWNNTVPIWIENEIQDRHDINKVKNKNDKTYKSASIYWPGSEAIYNNKKIHFIKSNYDPAYTFKKRYDKMIDLLLEPDPVNFITCYFEEPDNTAHQYGPDSKELKEKFISLDEEFGYFLNKLERANLYDAINIIIVSDHGMSTIKRENVYTLTDYTNAEDYDLIDYGTFLFLNPKDGKRENVYKKLHKIPHLKTYYKEDIPEEYHYKNNRRVSQIFALAEEGYFISPNKNYTLNNITQIFGDHGYSNKLKNMHGIFLAHGPAFKQNMKIKTIKNIDLYNLMCYILDLKPHPNNGTLDRVKSILKEKTLFTVIMKNPALIITLLSVCGLFIIVVILGCTLSCYRNLKDSSKRYTSVNDQEVPLTQWDENDDDGMMAPMK